MAILTTITSGPQSKRQGAISALKGLETELRRISSNTSAEDILELVNTFMSKKLGVEVEKPKAKAKAKKEE